MKFSEWVTTVPSELTNDPLWRMEVYQLGLFAGDLAWPDASKLKSDPRTMKLSGQLYYAVDSIAANIAEGYSRRSGKDQARFYEYALGSAREARVWYYDGRHILGQAVCQHRIQLLTKIIRLLMIIIPNERGYKIKEDDPEYVLDHSANLLNDPPLPE